MLAKMSQLWICLKEPYKTIYFLQAYKIVQINGSVYRNLLKMLTSAFF